MDFSKTELEIIAQKGRGTTRVSEIALALKKSESQLYRALQKLENKQIITKQRRNFEFNSYTHINLLVNNLLDHPNLCELLSGSGIRILQECDSQTSISEIAQKTELHPATIYKKITQFQNASIIVKSNNKYSLNSKLWQNLIDFIREFKKFNENIDMRVKPHTKIYYKDKNTILFSSKKKENATLTAFSVYEQYEIPILTTRMYYSLPIKKYTMKEVFLHSLKIIEKENDLRNILFATLFYVKYKKKLSNIDNIILHNIKQTLQGKIVRGYPTLKDIANRATLYDIKVVQ